jgi:signal transduction histidine kinase
MPADDAALDAPGSFAMLVDRDARVIRATVSAAACGALGRGRLETAVRAVVRELALGGGEASRVVAEPGRARHWIVRARKIEGEPWRARVVGFDASEAVAEAQRSFVPALVHEIRNVGFGLRSTVEALALEEPTADLLAMYVARMRGSFDRLAVLGDKLVALARPPALVRSRVELAALVDRAVDRVDVAVKAAGCAIARDLPDEAIAIDGDGAVLQAALGSLVENAARHGPPSATIRIRARRAGDQVEIAVLDEGAGPVDDARAEMFEPLVRRHGSGAGLGLTMARAAVVAHGGEVFAERSESGSFAVGMRLPVEDDRR